MPTTVDCYLAPQSPWTYLGHERFVRIAQQAIDAGVFGSPSYVIEGEIFWGQDRLARQG